MLFTIIPVIALYVNKTVDQNQVVNLATEDAYEDNDTVDTATTIIAGTYTIEVNDPDYFKIELDESLYNVIIQMHQNSSGINQETDLTINIRSQADVIVGTGQGDIEGNTITTTQTVVNMVIIEFLQTTANHTVTFKVDIILYPFQPWVIALLIIIPSIIVVGVGLIVRWKKKKSKEEKSIESAGTLSLDDY